MPSEHLRQRIANLRWPQADDTQSDPAAGDLWLATWEGARALVYVLSASDSTAEVAVATTPETGDDHTIIVSEDQAPVPGSTVHIWAGQRAILPRRAFDERLGSSQSLLEVVRAAIDDPTNAFPPIDGATDPRAERRAELEDGLDALERAAWQPANATRLRDLLPNVRPGQLAGQLSIDPGDADHLLSGQRSLTRDEAERAAILHDRGVDELLHASRPRVLDEIVVYFDQPERLRRVRRKARRLGLTEPEMMVEIAVPLMQQAARTTGHAERDWGALIDDALGD